MPLIISLRYNTFIISLVLPFEILCITEDAALFGIKYIGEPAETLIFICDKKVVVGTIKIEYEVNNDDEEDAGCIWYDHIGNNGDDDDEYISSSQISQRYNCNTYTFV